MRKADNLPPSYAVVMKSANLSFLEPSGPVQACNGTALPFYTGLNTIKIVTRIRNRDTTFLPVRVQESTSQYMIVDALDHGTVACTLGCNSKKTKIPNLHF